MALNGLARIIEGCIECGLCVEDCEFLKSFCETPKELAERFKDGYFRENPLVCYSCSLCGLCETLCTEGLNVGQMCLDMRCQLVKEGKGPLPSHRSIKDDQEWLSKNFTLAMLDPGVGECSRVFFPGCNLSGYSPALVVEAYKHLRRKSPTGIILGCCGAPTHCLGEESEFRMILGGVESDMQRLGASEMIVACPECYHTLKGRVSYRLTPLYQTIAEQGLPELAGKVSWTFSLHDSCSTRYEKPLQDSVRALTRQMGHQIEEMEHSGNTTLCCGMGGMIAHANLKLSNRVTITRMKEAKSDFLSYCASCREAFAFLGKPSLHILDLIFNPDWEKERFKPAVFGEDKRKNQSLLKMRLMELGTSV